MKYIGWIIYLCGCVLSMRMAKDSDKCKLINGLAIITIAIGLWLYFSIGGG